MKHAIFFGTLLISILMFTSLISTTEATQDAVIPSWIKNNAGWWADGQIDDASFVSGIQWLISNDLMTIPSTEQVMNDGSSIIPNWIKNTAGWWADNQISDDDFVNAIQYLIKVGIMTVPQTDNVTTDTSTVKPSASILDTTSFFEVKVDHILRNDPEYSELYTLNSDGLRGPEFSKDKPDNTYRIIAVGGSNTLGVGVTYENTWPRILEKELQNISEGKNIEVINGAAPGVGTSYYESKFIKAKAIQYEPDLIIVYDGHGDTPCKMVEHVTKYTDSSKENLKESCGVYSPDNYEKIYAERWSEICDLGKKNGFDTVFILTPIVDFGKILTDQELDSYFKRPNQTAYLNSLDSFAQQLGSMESHCVKAADFRDIYDYYFEPLFFDMIHVGNSGNEILSDKILELISPVLHEKGITKLVPTESNITKPIQDPEIILQLYEANWGNLLPNQKNFIGQNLSGKDFSNTNLENKIFFGSDLRGANFENSILSGSDFSLANLENANLKNAVIDGIKLRQTTLDRTDFTNVDFRQVNLMNVDLTNAILKNSHLDNKNLTKTFLYKADLSGADLSYSDLSMVYLEYTMLKDANLANTLLYEADLSLALNKDLSGTILANAVITHSDLVGIDFSGKDLSAINFYSSDLTGQDFSNDVLFAGTNFADTELSYANFEGAMLSPEFVFSTTFKNKAHLKNLPTSGSHLAEELFGLPVPFYTFIISKEVHGNDLTIDYIHFNDFSLANLENANFKNADLKFVNFASANLTNADLSGADLSNAYLGDADLSNANLDGAILDRSVLTCKNHPICN